MSEVESGQDRVLIGNGLTYSGVALMVLGMILFFDSGFLAIGNILFLFGLIVLRGPIKFLKLFKAKTLKSITGTVLFFLGVVLILFKFGFLGIVAEIVGAWMLFWSKLPQIINHSIQTLPGGQFLRMIPWLNQQSSEGQAGPILT
ncbi:hypothetical protein BLNAU_17667 [Blattamonas nauphoetae]|uniref:Uncharacterized protein n=1 Tax=Blattamonas nauphoetae TaxID=2049346 RepID=A0ABQ9X6L7_9EUKA|nr:hypothetical protein BLNAU_17667 [Blattamonas nauphoetae]